MGGRLRIGVRFNCLLACAAGHVWPSLELRFGHNRACPAHRVSSRTICRKACRWRWSTCARSIPKPYGAAALAASSPLTMSPASKMPGVSSNGV